MTLRPTSHPYRKILFLSLLILLGIGLYVTVNAQSTPPTHPDGWDLSFGENGVVNLCDSGSGSSSLHIQKDNRILVSTSCNGAVSSLKRFTANGMLDSNFGENGQVEQVGIGDGGVIGIQSNDKIIVSQSDYNTNYRYIARYTNDGIADTSFGDNGKTVQIEGANNQWAGMFILTNDKIMVYDSKLIVRFSPDGKLDPSLNNVGYILVDAVVTKPVNAATVSLSTFRTQQDNKMLLAIKIEWRDHPLDQQTWRQFLIARLNEDGKLDPTFANGGIYIVNEKVSDQYFFHLLPVKANGQILVAYNDGRQIRRLQSNGTVDKDLPLNRDLGERHKFILDSQGYILYYVFNGIERLLLDDTLDKSFGNNGQIESPIPAYMYDIALQQDGSLIVIDNPNRMLRNIKTKEYPTMPTSTPTATPTAPLPTPTATPMPPEQRSLAMIYAVFDNNLGEEWTRLVNNIEAGAHPGVDVRLLIDGPGTNDVYVYDIRPDSNPYCPSLENPTCNGHYPEQHFFTEDTARPHALYQFVIDSLNAFPQAPQVSLTIIGHGSGWGANPLPAQPSIWRGQNDTLGGMLWDDHPGTKSGSRSLSTLALGQALYWATAESERSINLLYLDGCSMGMSEVAYELRNRADFLLASPNTDWATFAYDQLLPVVDYQLDGRTLGERWLSIEAQTLRSHPGYPFTLALTDLQQIGTLTTTVSALADALQTILPDQRQQITLAFANSDRFDSNYDAKLDVTDSYIDLGDFAHQLQQVGITDTTLISSAQQVKAVMGSVVISTAYQSGTPWLAEEQSWIWHNFGGLSIYAPLHQKEEKWQVYYNKENLTWTADTTWDEFLTTFWATTAINANIGAEMPICQTTMDNCLGLAHPLPVQNRQYYVHVPLVHR